MNVDTVLITSLRLHGRILSQSGRGRSVFVVVTMQLCVCVCVVHLRFTINRCSCDTTSTTSTTTSSRASQQFVKTDESHGSFLDSFVGCWGAVVICCALLLWVSVGHSSEPHGVRVRTGRVAKA